MTEQVVPRVSERFCAPDSDITLQSSDGVLYKVHRKNLELHSEGFASADAISAASDNADDTEIVHLSESSAVLDLLLQYMHRQRQPDLTDVEFPILADLAEAAEKYEVYSAMTICNVHMRFAITSHPVEVLGYAFKHDYRKLMDEVAPLTIDKPVHELTAYWESIPNRIFTVWMKYHHEWLDVLNFVHKQYQYTGTHLNQYKQPITCSQSGLWEENRLRVALNLGANPGTLRDLEIPFGQRILCRVKSTGCRSLALFSDYFATRIIVS